MVLLVAGAGGAFDALLTPLALPHINDAWRAEMVEAVTEARGGRRQVGDRGAVG
jgi:uncharacterized Fe-S cluster-containing radical SAM superfamily enzyme